MKAINKLIVFAAALLCLNFMPVAAQGISISPTSLSWNATDTSEQPALVNADYGVFWTVTGYGSSFIVDTSEGEGWDFIHIRPAGINPGSADITAVLTISDGTSSCYLSLTQYGNGGDPTERIDLDGNWTIERTYTNANGTSSFEDITFYDGLGYPEQIVQVGASPVNSRNIVTPVWYDAMRRDDARSYLPYVSGNTGRAEENTSTVLSSQAAWYNSSGWSGQGAYAFSEQEYEQSPLNRIQKARKPGSTYASAVSGSKAAQLTYAANTASEVHKLTINNSGALVLSEGYYPAGTLHKTTATDEDGSVSVTWTDVLGHTVLSRQTSGSTNLDTYYVYDDAGQLRWVVTPEGSALLGTSGTWALSDGTGVSDVNNSNAAKYCYIYTWDGLGRQLSRKIPGKAVEYFVYDRAGRLVMSQDGLQRTGGKWVTLRYDNIGHLIRRALLSSSQGMAYFQNLFQSDNYPSVVYPSSGDTLLESFNYGSYSQVPSTLAFSAVSGVTPASADQTRIKGLKTYEKVAVLSGTGTPTQWIQRAFYYDQLGRLIQTVEANAMGTVSRYSSGYDFLGNVTASREQHGSDYKTGTFTYDSRGRLLSETTGVNGSVSATMAYAYDPLGRPRTATSGTGSGAVTTTDTYNIQGWLTARSAQKSGGTNIFSMNLGYYSPVQSGAAARYSGDISSWTWTQYGQGQKAYAYTYDGAHRLTAGQYYSGGSATNALSEKAIAYDRAGNITSLTRYNSSGAATTLSYSYTGNRLSSIGSASYDYDVNGNLKIDGRRGLSLTYNLLGHTANVSSGGTAKASYTYLSDGSLFEVANGSNGYRYLGSFIYNRNSSLESVAFGGGRIFKNGGSYSVDYHISDHLGSIRAIVRNGSVIEQNDYYPFGSRQDNGLPVQATPVANRFRFNGKELQTTGSLGYLNYGARFYDPDIARWNTCDILADIQNGLSPYSFCGGNPVLNVDDNGNIFETVWDAASFVMGVKSFVGNVKQGNVGAAIVDGVGIVGDALSIAAPFVPGGLSAGIAAARIAKNADNVVDAVKSADKAVDAAKSSNKVGDGVRAVEKLGNNTNSLITTSRAARREVMRREGIPTSQKPFSQSSNSSGKEYTYELPTSYGGTKHKSVQQQTKDRSHPDTPHWEGGDVKIHDGKIETNRYGRPRLSNGKTKVEYDEINHYN